MEKLFWTQALSAGGEKCSVVTWEGGTLQAELIQSGKVKVLLFVHVEMLVHSALVTCGFKTLSIAEVWQKSIFLLIKSDCSRIRQLFDGWIVNHAQKPEMALFQTFSTWHRKLSALTALYWPSTAFYWPSTTKYQPVPPSTDPVPSCINYYRPLLIQYHQVSTSIATYWPSAIIYQPVPPSTDPVTPSTNRNRLLLTQYQPILLGLGDYRLLHSLP